MKVRGKEIEVDVRGELEQFGWDNATWTKNKLLCASPFRNESRPSFFVRLIAEDGFTEGTWKDSGSNDAARASGDFISLLAILRNESREEVEDYLFYVYDSDKTLFRFHLDLKEKKKKTYPDPEILSKFDAKNNYLSKRGISEIVQKVLSTGYDSHRHLVTIPWFTPDGKLANIKYRRTDMKTFFYHRGAIPVGELVYAMHVIYKHRCKTAVLVEAEIDAMTLFSAGIPAIAVGGSDLSDLKARMIQKSPIEHLILLTDNDSAGEKLREQAARKLRNTLQLSDAFIPSPFKDVNELREIEKIKNVIQNRCRREIKII